LLVTLPAALVATTLYVPASAGANHGNESFVSISPGMAAPSFNHCKVGVGKPVTLTNRVTFEPTGWEGYGAGCTVMTGAVDEPTVTVAPLLATLPAKLVAINVYVAESPAEMDGNASFVSVAPAITAPFFNHCRVGAGLPVAFASRTSAEPGG